jgi:hypothetical protein
MLVDSTSKFIYIFTMSIFKEIITQALTLNSRERADVAQLLIQSLEISNDFETEWLDVVEKRKRDILSGAVEPIGWDEIKSYVTAK